MADAPMHSFSAATMSLAGRGGRPNSYVFLYQVGWGRENLPLKCIAFSLDPTGRKRGMGAVEEPRLHTSGRFPRPGGGGRGADANCFRG